jgi:hypothetical protein
MPSKPLRIFYCWQADLPSRVCRFFVRDALNRAKKELKQVIGREVEIDYATRDTAGTIDIPSTILRKIDECDAFVCDLSLVERRGPRKGMPNTNVLIEFGYAIHSVGYERIVVLANHSFGSFDEFPFDLGFRATVSYKLHRSATKSTLKARRDNIAALLTKELRPILASRKPPTPDPIAKIIAYAARDAIIAMTHPIAAYLARLGPGPGPTELLSTLSSRAPDAGSTGMPDPVTTRPFVDRLSQLDVLKPCDPDLQPEGTWLDWILRGIVDGIAVCDATLTKYAGRGPAELVVLHEELASRARTVVRCLQVAAHSPQQFPVRSRVWFELLMLNAVRGWRIWVNTLAPEGA